MKIGVKENYNKVVDVEPKPIGGLGAVMERVAYPEIAKRAGKEGKVIVRAYIDEKGQVVNTEVIKGIGAGCDESAMRAVSSSRFEPGKTGGKAVKSSIAVPILFDLK